MRFSLWKKLVLGVAACAVIAGPVSGSIATASGSRLVRLGAVPTRPAGSTVAGALASSAPMTVTVVLKPRDAAGLGAYATAVSTPGSSAYHQYLSVAGFRQRFGPTDGAIAAVVASLRAHGLSPGAVTANGLAIPVTATAGTIGKGFSTALERVTVAGGRAAFVNARAPLVDSSVAGFIQNVVGLNNLAVPHPVGLRTARARPRASKHVVTGGPQPCPAALTAASSNGTYTADQIASAYGFPGLYGAGDQGAGQTIAIYELEGNFPSDISAYKSCYGITAPVTYSAVDGGPSAPSFANGDGTETELDIENVLGLAPKANVIVYRGPNSSSNLPGAGPFDVYNAIISQNAAKVISTSWGLCEGATVPIPTVQLDENTLFQEAAVQGQSIFAASGDNGSEDCGGFDTSLAVDDPGSQPFVTSAGGTALSAIGPPPAETVWNGLCGIPAITPCGGGGGISAAWAMPSYQSAAAASLHVINSSSSRLPCVAQAGTFCREVPDVSANADPSTGYTIYYHGNGSASDATGWKNGTPLGGTSAVTPLWAALIADVNALSACRGIPVGFANPVLYGTASHMYAGHFNDVTAGNNDITRTNGGRFSAWPGYDMASGLGTPNATALAVSLCLPSIGVASPGSQTSVLRSAASLQIIASDSAGYPVGYSATGLPPRLSINSLTGRITGRTTAAGKYTVTVRALDSHGAFGSATFGWIVTGIPKQSRASLTGIAKGAPKLTFTLTAGVNEAGLKRIVASLPKGLSFSPKTRNLRKGVGVSGPNGKPVHGLGLKVSGGRLRITLPSARTQLVVTIGSATVSASTDSVSKIKKKKPGTLTVTLNVVDASGNATTLALKLKPA